MHETIAHAASLSDRRSARRQNTELGIADGRLVLRRGDADEIASGPIVGAWHVGWDSLPRGIAPIVNNGAVAVHDDRGIILLPVDEWWMQPSVVSQPSTALASSGLQRLLDVYPSSDRDRPVIVHPRVIVPRGAGLRTRVDRPLTVAFFVAIAALLVGYASPLLGAVTPWGRATWILGMSWLAVALAVVVVIGASGRLRTRVRTQRRFGPVSGPHWFRLAAGIGLSDRGLVVRDGQGLAQVLSVPARSGGGAVVSRARFVDDAERGRVLLLDRADVVRAQVPTDRWLPTVELRVAFVEFLHECGVITETGPDLRDSADISLDERRNRRVGVGSLLAWNSLGVAPLRASAGIAFVEFVLFAGLASGSRPVSTALFALAAAASMATVVAVMVVESASRLPVETATTATETVPRRRWTVRGALVVVIPLIGVLVAVVAVGADEWPLGVELLLVGFAIPCIAWLTQRRRRAERGRAPLSAWRWFLAGAPRGD